MKHDIVFLFNKLYYDLKYLRTRKVMRGEEEGYFSQILSVQ